jgi:hypothetical protein
MSLQQNKNCLKNAKAKTKTLIQLGSFVHLSRNELSSQITHTSGGHLIKLFYSLVFKARLIHNTETIIARHNKKSVSIFKIKKFYEIDSLTPSYKTFYA